MLSKSCFRERAREKRDSFVTFAFRRLDCSLVCPSVVNFSLPSQPHSTGDHYLSVTVTIISSITVSVQLLSIYLYRVRAVYLRSWLISITTGRSSCPRQADRLSFTLCVLQVTAPAQSRPTCLSLSLTHTMCAPVHTLCAPGHSSCAEQADLSVSLSLSHTLCVHRVTAPAQSRPTCLSHARQLLRPISLICQPENNVF